MDIVIKQKNSGYKLIDLSIHFISLISKPVILVASKNFLRGQEEVTLGGTRFKKV